MLARDLAGYGEFPPNPAWPNGAQIAVNFNLNIEGGGESTLANGDTASEGMLNDIGGQAIVFFVLVVAAAEVVVGGDGQVSIGQTVIKSNAKKVRKLGKGDVIGGFAGATADAFTLF